MEAIERNTNIQSDQKDSPMNFRLPLTGFEIVAVLTIFSLFSMIG